MNLLDQVRQAVQQALVGIAPDPAATALQVKPAQDSRHGDYQANCAMALAKVVNLPPRTVAQQIIDRLDLGDRFQPPEIAGPGFINLKLRDDWLAAQMRRMAADPRLLVSTPEKAKTFVIDYSGPNVAKPMHVGHLRSTIIGDSLIRLMRFLGHRVVGDNHLGDWGTQFGIILYGYKNHLDRQAYERDPVRELARLYVDVRKMFRKADDEDAEAGDDPIASACRAETAKLHTGDAENLALWREFMPYTYEELRRVYARLCILPFDHQHGESFYHPMLAGVVEQLLEQGIAERSDGAVVVFFDAERKRFPALIQKRDGAFTYTTSDLATISYRVKEFAPDRILYVVDFRQKDHFANLFDICKRWGFDRVALEHVSFGSVLDAVTGKPIKTRDGGGVSLEQLLDESVTRALQAYRESVADRRANGHDVPALTAEDEQEMARIIGIGAVKYADLSQSRTSDYTFSWDKMLAMNGNTATYMQYAYARNRSIFRKGNEDVAEYRANPPAVVVSNPAERALALQLLQFEDALNNAAEDAKPNFITAYLWDLSSAYSTFYQGPSVLDAETPELRKSRLVLCDLTARVLKQGLELLGIETVERM